MSGVFYEENKGTGSPVIFLPGLGWPGRMGKNVADELMPDFHTYLLDLPGIGRSDSLRGTLFFADMGDWEVERHIKLVRQCRPDISLLPVEWGHYVHWAPTPVTPFIREFLIKHEES
ncbi:MAG: alpha/beta fold hydrolase [Bacilli bacterium]